MKVAVALLSVALLVGLSSAEPTKREQALARIDEMIEHGHHDEAEKAIEHLLAHNAGDADLLALREKLRIRQGNLAALLEGGKALAEPARRKDLREACWRIVEATACLNPEEAPALRDVGDPERAARVARHLEEHGHAVRLREIPVDELEKRAAAGDLDAVLRLPADRVCKHEKVVLAALGVPDTAAQACAAAARMRSPEIRAALTGLVRRGPPETVIAATGALLAQGDRSAWPVLERILREGKPAWQTAALAHMAAHPAAGGGGVALLERMETSPPRPRLRDTCREIVIAALGRAKEKGVREALEKRLADPAVAMAAARALGERGDPAAVPAVLAYLLDPPRKKGPEAAAGGGLGYLGGTMGGSEVVRAVEMQPRLVAALALLRMTRPR